MVREKHTFCSNAKNWWFVPSLEVTVEIPDVDIISGLFMTITPKKTSEILLLHEY